MTASGVPSATTWPPWTPAPGPISTSQSAVRIASSSCSTTMTVLPRSRSRLRVVEQPVVVALVQPDRRLVEHIEHAGQPRADLRGEPDALALAARQGRPRRATGSGSRARHSCKNPSRSLISLAGCAGRSRFGSGSASASMPGEPVRPRRRSTARAASLMCLPAILTASASGFSRAPSHTSQVLRTLVAAQFLAHPGAVGLAIAPLHVGQHALERPLGRVFAAARRHRSS